MLDLSLFLLLQLLALPTVVAVHYLRPRHTRRVALAFLVFNSLLWILLPGQLPIAFEGLQFGDPALQSEWQWRVDSAPWLLSLALFLLQIGALLAGSEVETGEQRIPSPVAIVLLGAGAHLSFWAFSLAAFVVSWTLLGLSWLVTGWANVERPEHHGRFLLRLAPGFAAIFLLWLAAATIPGGEGQLNIARWPTLTKSLTVLAVALQVAFVPATVWTARVSWGQNNVAALLYTTPIAAGAMLLARLEGASDIGLAFALPLTLIALLGILFALRQAWSPGAAVRSLAGVLITTQACLLLLAGVWAGPQAVLAEARVLLLGGGILLLAARQNNPADERLLFRVGPLLAVAALTGFPLTAGFTGRSALYDVWSQEGRWILLLVSALLHLLLIAAAFKTILAEVSFKLQAPSSAGTPGKFLQLLGPVSDRSPPGSSGGPPGRRQALSLAGLLLPAAGLAAVSGLAHASLVSWLAVLLPIAMGLTLLRFIRETEELQNLLREAFALRAPVGRLQGISLRRVSGGIATAVREAALILEGEGGLLWLLLFMVILWLAR